jgi:hypothetical protein
MDLFFLVGFSLDSELEINQAIQPLAPFFPLNMAWKDK